MDHATGHLLTDLPTALAAEQFDTLLQDEDCRLERIISIGHATAPGDWFDQDEDEWVVVLQGRAAVRFADEAVARSLAAGDYLWIPARCRHRVEWTSATPPVVWLALHLKSRPSHNEFSPVSA